MAYEDQIIRFTKFTQSKGRFRTLTSLVYMISGINRREIPLAMMLVVVPSSPQIERDRRSKLKI